MLARAGAAARFTLGPSGRSRRARLALAFIAVGIAQAGLAADCRRAEFDIAWREVEHAPVTRVSDAEIAAGAFPWRSGDSLTRRRVLTSLRWRLCASEQQGVPQVPSELRDAIGALAVALPDDLLEQVRRNRFAPGLASAAMSVRDGETVSLDQLAASLSTLWALDGGQRGARLHARMIEADLQPIDLIIAGAGARLTGNNLVSELWHETASRLFHRIDALGPTSGRPSQCSRVAAYCSVELHFRASQLSRSLTVVVCDAPQAVYMFRYEAGWTPLGTSEVCALVAPPRAPNEVVLKRLLAGIDCEQRLALAAPEFDRVVSDARRPVVIDEFAAPR